MERKRHPGRPARAQPPRALDWERFRSAPRSCRLLRDALSARSELRPPNAAAQRRVVSVVGILLDSRESERPFKGIFCHDISEFESYMAGHAVGSL